MVATVVGRGKLPLLRQLRFLVLLLLCLLARRLRVLFARSKSFRQSERSDPTEIPHIERS